MRLLARRLVTTTGGRTVLAVLVVLIAWQLHLVVQAGPKISEDLRAESGQVDAEVTLRFPPERFHILRLQEFGRVTSTTPHGVHLRRTTVDDLHGVARFHWVVRIEPLEEVSPAERFRSSD